MTPPENDPRTPPPGRDAQGAMGESPWALAGLGMQFAVALLLFGGLGRWVDQRFGTEPFGLLLGVLLGGGGFFALAVRRLTRGME